MKKMHQFPGATSANLLLFALCLIALSLCTAKHEDDFATRTPFVRNRSVNHQGNVIISHTEPFPKSLWSNLIYSNEPQHDERIIKSATHDERFSSSDTRTSATGSAPLGASPRRRVWKITSAVDDDARNSAMPHSSRHSLQRRDIRHSATPINLCNEKGCTCTKQTLMDVTCELQGRQYDFNHKYHIPKEAWSLTMHLAKNTRLHIHRDFFQQNHINRILINGTKESEAHVEFMENALQENNGSMLEINIINCHTVVLKNGTFHDENKINFTNCREVIVYDGALSQTSFNAVFDNIGHLKMNPHARIAGDRSTVTITNSFIDRLESVGGMIKELRIVNSVINEIVSNAFGITESMSIDFENTRIDKIQREAFPQRVLCSQMRIVDCNITTIHREAIANCGCQVIIIERNRIKTIAERGISAFAAQASISFNKIEKAEKHWLKISQFDKLEVNNNSFGHFGAMDIEELMKRRICKFEMNSITNADGGSLRLPQDCIVKSVLFQKTCECGKKWLSLLDVSSFQKMTDEIYCSTGDLLKPCFNANLTKLTTYYREVCSDSKVLDCMETQKDPKMNGNFIKPGDFGKDSGRNNLVYWITTGVVCLIILLLLIGIVIVVVRKRGNRTDRAGLITATPEHSHHSVERVPRNTRIFTPEDQIIINQTLDKMKLKYPAEKYDQVYNNTQKLFNGSLTESEKVLTIGEIVGTLSKCENSGEDFVAFTDILYKHLAPKDNNQNDPVYAEPNLIGSNDVDDRNTQLDLNHIYAEPQSVQQPLLNNEYALPVDRNTESGLYTEPVVSPKDLLPHARIIQNDSQ
ncbi:uncharacterized protein LOC132263090 isoform X2 [Phlebotomus argentipes]|uniref:uncharacterized protein LOC132263090 isoform X2 n=1 Tax=Phlebotomus argentipes TaxID=94469 RepID=UPI0028933606|nr:uncharacterized protein LOC132263090 isoform X2 [Phlebotomus argentipes]